MRKSYIIFSLLLATTVGALNAMEYKDPDKKGVKTRQRVAYKAETCLPATQIALLEFNTVSSRFENGGNLWNNRSNSTAAYEVPKGGGVRALFAGALWMGGKSETGQLKLAAVTFRTNGNDYWPGPLKAGSSNTEDVVCTQYDKFFRAYKPDAQLHHAWALAKRDPNVDVNELFPGYQAPSYFEDWPGNFQGANTEYDQRIAPFKDWNQNDVYEPEDGDYPGYNLGDEITCRDQARDVPLFGDTTIYWIFNDKGNVHTESGGSEPIGMEIRAQAFSFASEGPINNMTFYNYVMINQGTQTLDSTYFGQWADSDLGNPNDDYVGCDVQRGLGYAYNGDETDDVTGGPAPGYGQTPPAIGIDFFQGPYQDNDGIDNPGPYDEDLAPFGFPDSTSNADKYSIAKTGNGIPYSGLGIGYGDGQVDNERFGMRKFVYYNIGGQGIAAITDPSTPQDYYNFLRGIWKDGSPMYYGGNGHNSSSALGPAPVGADLTRKSDFMFPGNTDPVGFGVGGDQSAPEWTEDLSGNQPGDRRFMQSAGPFRLLPGAVNNITVGVVWARAAQGQTAQQSVTEMKIADDIAQSLFDNCFQIFEGPDAPDLKTVELDQEIILILDNPSTSNNFNEAYEKKRQEIPSVANDNTYNFEGYLIYQVRDQNTTVSELSDETRARLIAQTDVKNFEIDPVTGEADPTKPIGVMHNWLFNDIIEKPYPVVRVEEAANGGIKKTFRITQDAFAEGDPTLVNSKKYYFMALAYAYNNWQDYDPKQLTGQAEMFVSSRKNGRGGGILPITAIPKRVENHKEVKVNANYGETFPVTRTQGVGSSNLFLEIEDETVQAILANNQVDVIKYKRNAGPVQVKIVDPLAIKDGEFELSLVDSFGNAFFEDGRWVLKDLNNGTVYNSERTLDLAGEQIIPEFGISIELNQHIYSGDSRYQETDLIGADMKFADPSNPWLTGVADQDVLNPLNWIRAGRQEDSPGADNTKLGDANQVFETVLGGTWTAFGLGSSEAGGPFPSTWQSSILESDENKIAGLTNVNIVLTDNKDLWTRCVVMEMADSAQNAEAVAGKGSIRQGLSVDKNGLSADSPDPDGLYNQAEAELISDIGMGWFPGYAIDVETGMRLNMAFGEASDMPNHNGNDMIWNPTSVATEMTNDPFNPVRYVFGGRHYIMVFKPYVYRLGKMVESKDGGYLDYVKYDSCRTIREDIEPTFSGNQFITPTAAARRVFKKGNWIGLPLLANGATLKSAKDGLIPNDVTLRFRVKKQYQRFPTAGNNLDDTTGTNTFNPYAPKYFFSSAGFEPTKIDKNDYSTILDYIKAVPNPYYAYYTDEEGKLDNKVDLVNLPNNCTISIFSLDGTRVRTFKKSSDNPILGWDLKNEKGIPISSGVYLIHINAPEFGEKVVRWFGVTRQTDLQNF